MHARDHVHSDSMKMTQEMYTSYEGNDDVLTSTTTSGTQAYVSFR